MHASLPSVNGYILFTETGEAHPRDQFTVTAPNYVKLAESPRKRQAGSKYRIISLHNLSLCLYLSFSQLTLLRFPNGSPLLLRVSTSALVFTVAVASSCPLRWDRAGLPIDGVGGHRVGFDKGRRP